MTASGPYAAAARLYLESGWHPLPLPWGKKGPPPLGTTGHGGHPPTIHTVRMWSTKPAFADKARGNVGLVMSDEQIGVDVDHYGNKTGGDTLAALEERLGPLPPTAVSTARDDRVSGIRFYRVPAGRKWKESAGKDIEIIQRVHRYAVAWPSIHDKLGSEYR
jgi:Bifunctional DNA primase/polymerase, N-terminal